MAWVGVKFMINLTHVVSKVANFIRLPLVKFTAMLETTVMRFILNVTPTHAVT